MIIPIRIIPNRKINTANTTRPVNSPDISSSCSFLFMVIVDDSDSSGFGFGDWFIEKVKFPRGYE